MIKRKGTLPIYFIPSFPLILPLMFSSDLPFPSSSYCRPDVQQPGLSLDPTSNHLPVRISLSSLSPCSPTPYMFSDHQTRSFCKVSQSVRTDDQKN
ncbi:hypothetical protein B0H34DRAFT_734392 [Crassisporium funariophilum]|nr:hypothetical protein B0H34DRAFT_734392 [Crassisporium funariophilum]